MTRDRHASRASFACVRCKKDKRRCDISLVTGKDPENLQCTACRNRNEKCEVRYGEDKRTTRPSQDTKALTRRIAALESMLKNASQAEKSPEKNDEGKSNTQQSERQSSADALPQAHPPTALPVSPSTSASPNDTRPTPLRNATERASSQPASNAQDIADYFPSGMDEVTAPTRGFRGQSEGRNSQYFGSPNLFPYAERQYWNRDARDQNGLTPEEANRRARASLEAFPEPGPIITHLLDLFWKWQSSHLIVVDREIFLRHRQIWDETDGSGDRNFYTPCLLYAILAKASLISPDMGVKRYSASDGAIAGDKFSKRARALFELEMEYPTITTVQAAIILGSRYEDMIENSLGWTFSGIAFRMASKLGLHLDCTKAVASGHISAEMAKLRTNVFWGCHIEDNLFSSYCSRPPFFMDWDITIPIPDTQVCLDESMDNHHSPFLLGTTSKLSVICSRTLVSFYGQRRRNTADQLRSLASQVHKDLWQWYQDLPDDFILTDNNDTKVLAPEVFVLHMHFYFVLILLHRPFLRFSQVLHDLTNLDDLTSTSTGTCAMAASNITKLILNYQRFYSIRQIPAPTVHYAFIAGTIHLVNFRLTHVDTHYKLLESCMAALSEMSNSYPIGFKATSVLQDLIEGWEPSKESTPVAIPCTGQLPDKSPTAGIQPNYDWFEIEVPPMMDIQGLPDFETDSINESGLADASSVLPKEMEMVDQLGALGQVGDDSLVMESGARWSSERELFDIFYGSTFALA